VGVVAFQYVAIALVAALAIFLQIAYYAPHMPSHD
jgi:hypothetical protein